MNDKYNMYNGHLFEYDYPYTWFKRNKNYFDFKNKNWDDNLKNINIEVKSNTKINSSGEIRK